jgi:hypothetical protein
MSAEMERTLDTVMKLRKRLESTVGRLEAEQKGFQEMLRQTKNEKPRRYCVWAVFIVPAAILFLWVISPQVLRDNVLIC